VSIYGFIISFAILVCLLLAEKRATAKNAGFFWNLALITIVSGLIGARIYHIIDFWSYYSTDPIKVLFFWRGGLGIWGGIIGAFICGSFYIKLKKEGFAYWLDLMAGVLPLGQAIGRWGNFFNQENFGYPTTLSWGIYIDGIPGQKFHPLFLYESLLNLILFLVLNKFKPGSGKVIVLYLLGYSTIRFFLEFLRMDPWIFNDINIAQLVSVVVTLACALYLVGSWRFQSKK